MVDLVAGLKLRPPVARVRKIERKPRSNGEDKEALLEKKKARPAKLKKNRLPESPSPNQKGSFCDLLL